MQLSGFTMNSERITSDEKIQLETHFKISAGPGAGKTYWLVNHILNVLYNSNRLSNCKKIACITYTNIGTETILKRLGNSSSRVDVSTIHSFFYRHVVKPYAYFLKDDFDLNISKLDGHDEIDPSYKIVETWLEDHKNKDLLKNPFTINQLTKLENKRFALFNWLRSLYYKFDENKKLILTGNEKKAIFFDEQKKPHILGYKNCLVYLEPDLLKYKQLFWTRGMIDHDDVLFFSYHLIKKYPFILNVLRAKFPYFFIDEFQDTNPIQAELIKLIGLEETVIGVIGDFAQAIYEFQGAAPNIFKDFDLPGLKNYSIKENRRSTIQIIEVLNDIRSDIKQKSFLKVNGNKPLILIGDMFKAKNIVESELDSSQTFSILSRKNITANLMKNDFNEINISDNLLDRLSVVDQSARSRVLINFMKALEYSKEGSFKESLKFVKKNYYSLEESEKLKKSLRALRLLNKYNATFFEKPIIEFHKFVRENVYEDIPNFRAGKIKDFYSSYTYFDISLFVKIKEDKNISKTIHKAKGDEFDNVLLLIPLKDKFVEENEYSFLLNPNLELEEHRIYYVAMSRARENLYISLPKLSSSNRKKIKNFEIIDI
jgi:DNA helicase-2/ATP-dependent DNA helicase PcrA